MFSDHDSLHIQTLIKKYQELIEKFEITVVDEFDHMNLKDAEFFIYFIEELIKQHIIIGSQVDKIRYSMSDVVERTNVLELLNMFDEESGEFKASTLQKTP